MTSCAFFAAVLGCRSAPLPEDARAGASQRLGLTAPAVVATSTQSPRLSSPLDAAQAVAFALEHAPAAREALAELGIERADALRSARISNPMIHGELRFSSDDTALEVSLVQSLSGIIYGAARHDSAVEEVQGAKEVAVGRLLDLARRVRRAHLAYRAELARFGLIEAADAGGRARVEIADELHRVGNINALRRDSEQAQSESLALLRLDAAARVWAKRASLSALIGASIDEPWTVSAVLDPLPPEERLSQLEETALEHSTLLSGARARRASASARAKVLGWQGVLPELGAGLAVQREHGETAVGPVVALALPIFDQGRADVARAEAESDKYRAAEEQAVLEVRAEAARVRAEISRTRAKVTKLAEVLVPLRRRIVEGTIEQLNAMNASPFQLLDARQKELETQLAWVDAVESYGEASIDLGHLLAGGSPAPSTAASSAAPPPPEAAAGSAH